jgi:hypothetical protein
MQVCQVPRLRGRHVYRGDRHELAVQRIQTQR